MLNRILAVSALFATAALPAAAAPETYVIDDAHTSVLFFVNHLGFSNMQGEFQDVEATLVLDRDNPERSTLSVTLKSVGVDLDHDELNYHVRSSDFFDVLKFPAVTFKSTQVVPGPDNTAVVTGDLTMLGQTHPVSLSVLLEGDGINPISNARTVAFHATGSLKRSRWGMTYLVPNIGDEVSIRIDSEFIRSE